MEKDFKELENTIRDEVLQYLVSGGADLSKREMVQDALDDFYSDTIENYMDDNGLELGYKVSITEDNNIVVSVWEW